eukprot:6198532-Pleurochrysis_carterae.AAC.1
MKRNSSSLIQLGRCWTWNGDSRIVTARVSDKQVLLLAFAVPACRKYQQLKLRSGSRERLRAYDAQRSVLGLRPVTIAAAVNTADISTGQCTALPKNHRECNLKRASRNPLALTLSRHCAESVGSKKAWQLLSSRHDSPMRYRVPRLKGLNNSSNLCVLCAAYTSAVCVCGFWVKGTP